MFIYDVDICSVVTASRCYLKPASVVKLYDILNVSELRLVHT